MNYKKTEYYEDIEIQCEIIDNMQRAIMDAGGKLFSRRELLDMSIEDLLYICVRNNINLTMKFVRSKKHTKGEGREYTDEQY